MIKIYFSRTNEPWWFEGEVLEVFHGERSQRIHVVHIKTISINTDRNGNHSLRVETYWANLDAAFDEQLLPKVNELIAEVQRAKASFQG